MSGLTASLAQLQRELMPERLQSIDDLHRAVRVRWATHEASSLSWMSGFPLIFFPSLFEEKTATALKRARRQNAIHARSRKLRGLTG